MSSLAVRNKIEAFLAANVPTEKVVPMDGHYEDIEDVLQQYSVGMNDTWIGINYLANDDQPMTTPATNDKGKYRESGIVQIHIVDVAKLGVSDSILNRAETLRDLLRGQNINGVRVNSVTPANFNLGATLEFESGFISATIVIDYDHDLDL